MATQWDPWLLIVATTIIITATTNITINILIAIITVVILGDN